MSIAKQLYQLQEVDLELESTEQAIRQMTSQLGESEALVRARNKLSMEHQRLEELRKQQRSLEWEIDDLAGKLTKAEGELYSGRIRNPKELTSLQQEVEVLKAHRDQLENKVLELMDQVEHTTKRLAVAENECKAVETEWHERQRRLSIDLERLKTVLSNLTQKRKQLAAEIESQVIDIYHGLRKQKGTAVARVEQGICRGCRISLPVSELQRARSGTLVRCGSCGRILYLA